MKSFLKTCRRITSIVGKGAAIVAALSMMPGYAAEDVWPSKPVRIVVAWSAGGTTDAAARVLAQKLSDRTGTPFVVDNKPGANGRIGAELASKAPADGYTLFLASAETHAINQHVFQRMPYDPTRSFVNVAPFATNAFAIVTRPDLNMPTLKDVVAFGRANPEKLTFASWGVGSTSHLGMEMFRDRAGIRMLHVPFQGEAPALNAVMAGQVDLMMLSAQKAELLAREGKVKVLASTSEGRYFAVPGVATLRENGYDLTITNWFAISAPTGTPQPVIDRLSREIVAAAARPEVLTQLRALGLDAPPQMSGERFQQFVRDEDVKWGAIVRQANVRLD